MKHIKRGKAVNNNHKEKGNQRMTTEEKEIFDAGRLQIVLIQRLLLYSRKLPGQTSRCRSLGYNSGCDVLPGSPRVPLWNQPQHRFNEVCAKYQVSNWTFWGQFDFTGHEFKRWQRCVQPATRAGGWRCGGPGRATGDTARVYTSAGDCIEGVSSAGGVKSISSSKWSSNSYIK